MIDFAVAEGIGDFVRLQVPEGWVVIQDYDAATDCLHIKVSRPQANRTACLVVSRRDIDRNSLDSIGVKLSKAVAQVVHELDGPYGSPELENAIYINGFSSDDRRKIIASLEAVDQAENHGGRYERLSAGD